MTSVVDLDTGRPAGLLGLTPGRSGAAVEAWAGPAVTAVEGGHRDRRAGAAIRKALPHAVIVVDHWHLVRLANQVVTEVRQRVAREQLGRRGRKTDLVLAIAVCAVLAGARSYLAIAEWAHDLTPAVRLRLGLGRTVPCETTIRRLLQSVDAEELDRVLSAWLASRTGPGLSAAEPRRQVAIDGKTARGARCGEDPAVHLLAAFDTGTGTVLGQGW